MNVPVNRKSLIELSGQSSPYHTLLMSVSALPWSKKVSDNRISDSGLKLKFGSLEQKYIKWSIQFLLLVSMSEAWVYMLYLLIFVKNKFWAIYYSDISSSLHVRSHKDRPPSTDHGSKWTGTPSGQSNSKLWSIQKLLWSATYGLICYLYGLWTFFKLFILLTLI